MTAGRLQKKNDYFYIVLSYKTKAEELLLKYREEFDINRGKLFSESKIIKEETKEEDILFGEYLIQWLEKIKSTIDLSTYAGYKINIKSRIAPYFNSRGITLKNINAHIIDDFYSDMLKEVSPNTVIHFHANIRKALQDAYKDDLIPCNYADKAHRPKKNEFISNYYNRDELLILFDAVKGLRIEFPVIMAGYYGMRRGEIVGLKWSNIDFEYNTITIKHTVSYITLDGKTVLISKDRAKTQKSIRTLPLVPPVKELLLKMKRMEDANKEFFGSDYYYGDDDYIYKNEKGKLISPDYVTQNFAIQVQKIKSLEKIRFHDLRHSCAALLRHEGVPMEDIQKWLGHSQITTTESIYAHFEDKTHLKSAQKILNAFGDN